MRKKLLEGTPFSAGWAISLTKIEASEILNRGGRKAFSPSRGKIQPARREVSFIWDQDRR